MYCQFYGLKEKPFNVTSDSAFFFLSRKHKEALSHLVYGVNQRKGIIVITGEIGTGKTTLCRFFLGQLKKNIKTALILNPYLSEIELWEVIMEDFGIKVKDKNSSSFIWKFNRFLLKEAKSGNNVILVIDEAQNLKPSQLEQIRLLSNLETQKNKLIQIVLVGQPELNQRLSLYELRQLRQRIMVKYHILPLDESEIETYINYRLDIAGSMNRIEFSTEALKVISDFSGGIPRLINIICDRALLAGFVTETNSIDLSIMRKCLDDLGSYFTGKPA